MRLALFLACLPLGIAPFCAATTLPMWSGSSYRLDLQNAKTSA